jgi:hypothetical protein
MDFFYNNCINTLFSSIVTGNEEHPSNNNCIKKDEKLYVLLDLALCKIYMIVCLISSIYRFCKCKKEIKKIKKFLLFKKLYFPLHKNVPEKVNMVNE